MGAGSETKAGAGKTGDAADATLACSCALARRAARQMTQAYDRALKPAGMRLTQYAVLSAVRGEGGRTISDIADMLAMDRTTLTRNLRPLEKAGWVRVGDGADRRCRAVFITEEGRAAFARAMPFWEEAERGFRDRVGQADAAALRQLLRAVTKAAAA